MYKAMIGRNESRIFYNKQINAISFHPFDTKQKDRKIKPNTDLSPTHWPFGTELINGILCAT